APLLAAAGLPYERALAVAQRGFVHVELVGHDLALHHGFAQSPAGGEEDDAAVAALRIEREKDAGGRQVRPHHLLHADGERDLAVLEPHVLAIAEGARREEARETTADGVEDSLFAADIEKGVLLPGEARARKVLGGRGRADRHVGEIHRVSAGEVAIGPERFFAQL